eukprot:gene3939-4904_t
MPSMVPTEYAITTQTFTATFKTLVYADLARNESLYSLFITEYATAVSRSAEVPVSQVRVIELYEGSVVVKAQLNYTALDVLSGADPAKFAAIIEDNTGKGISSVISSSSFLVVYIGNGVEYMWEGTSSDGKVLALDNDINKHDSLQLYLPRHFLTANVMYHVRLRAALCGNRRVFAKAYTSFAVPSQPLVALINGGNVRTAEGSPIRLDAGASVDPDEAPGEIYYKWKCVRTDRAALDANVSGLGDRGDAGEYTVNWE